MHFSGRGIRKGSARWMQSWCRLLWPVSLSKRGARSSRTFLAFLFQLMTIFRGYPPLWEKLFGVFAFTHADFYLVRHSEGDAGRLSCPVREFADYYFYDPVPKICRMVYFPTGHTVENDRILFDFCRKSNVELTVVSDEYRFLCDALRYP